MHSAWLLVLNHPYKIHNVIPAPGRLASRAGQARQTRPGRATVRLRPWTGPFRTALLPRRYTPSRAAQVSLPREISYIDAAIFNVHSRRPPQYSISSVYRN